MDGNGDRSEIEYSESVWFKKNFLNSVTFPLSIVLILAREDNEHWPKDTKKILAHIRRFKVFSQDWYGQS